MPVLWVGVRGCGNERNLLVDGPQCGLTAQRLMPALSHVIVLDPQGELKRHPVVSTF